MEIALRCSPQKHTQLVSSVLGLTGGYVKARPCQRAPGTSLCHTAAGCWWHFLLASMDNNAIPTAVPGRGVRQDLRIDFPKRSSSLQDFPHLFKLRDPHAIPASQPAKVLLLHLPFWYLSSEKGYLGKIEMDGGEEGRFWLQTPCFI